MSNQSYTLEDKGFRGGEEKSHTLEDVKTNLLIKFDINNDLTFACIIIFC